MPNDRVGIPDHRIGSTLKAYRAGVAGLMQGLAGQLSSLAEAIEDPKLVRDGVGLPDAVQPLTDSYFTRDLGSVANEGEAILHTLFELQRLHAQFGTDSFDSLIRLEDDRVVNTIAKYVSPRENAVLTCGARRTWKARDDEGIEQSYIGDVVAFDYDQAVLNHVSMKMRYGSSTVWGFHTVSLGELSPCDHFD